MATLIVARCEHATFSVLVDANRNEALIGHATMITRMLPEAELVQLLREHICSLKMEIDEAECLGLKRYPQNEENLKSIIAVIAIALVAGRSQIEPRLCSAMSDGAASVIVSLDHCAVTVAIKAAGHQYETAFHVSSAERRVVHRILH